MIFDVCSKCGKKIVVGDFILLNTAICKFCKEGVAK